MRNTQPYAFGCLQREERKRQTWLLDKEIKLVLMWEKQTEIHSKTFLIQDFFKKKGLKLSAPRTILGHFFKVNVHYFQHIYLLRCEVSIAVKMSGLFTLEPVRFCFY